MDQFQRYISRFRALVAAKLGKCPRCMKLSIQGSGLAWTLFAIARLLTKDSIVSLLPLVLALAFTILMLAHVVAFMVRVGGTVRKSQTEIVVPGRRRFVRIVAIAGFSFAAAGFLGAIGARAQGSLQTCAICLAGKCHHVEHCPKGEKCIKNLNKNFCTGQPDGVVCGNCQR